MAIEVHEAPDIEELDSSNGFEGSRSARFFYQASRIAALLSFVAIFLATIYEVIARYVFNSPTTWSTEYAAYLLAATTFLGAAYTQLRNGNIRVTMLYDALPVRWMKTLDTFASWVAVLVVTIAFWRVLFFWRTEYLDGSRSFSLVSTPLWIPQTTVVIGMLLLIVALLYSATRVIAAPIPQWKLFAGAAVFLAMIVVVGIDGFRLVRIPPMSVVIVITAAVALTALLWAGKQGGLAVAGGMAPLLLLFYLANGASAGILGLTFAIALVYLLLSSVPVAFALISIGLLSIVFLMPIGTITVLGERTWGAANSFELTAVPMFILMGALLARSEASTTLFVAMQKLFGRFRGGSAYATIVAAGLFSAVSGSSAGTAATMGRIAGSEMTKQGYGNRLAYGVIAAGGTLGPLIPPSVAMVLYSALSGVPVTSMFLAGVIPGLVTMGLFAVIVAIWTIASPKSTPAGHAVAWWDKFVGLRGAVPFVLLFLLLLFGLTLGIVTPTEGGALGVVGALAICLWRGQLTYANVLGSIEEAALVTCFILLIVVGSSYAGFAVDFLGLGAKAASYVRDLGLDNFQLLLGIMIFYIVLGMFLEGTSMMYMTLPLVLPVVLAVGWDPVWFGIVLILLIEVGLITPPVGMILFVLQGISGNRVTLGEIASGALPFVFALVGTVFLIFLFPNLVTVLLN